MKRRTLVFVIVAGFVAVLVAVGVIAFRGRNDRATGAELPPEGPGTLREDPKGPTGFRGTGWAVYRYRGGATKLKECFVEGRAVRSVWFRPDGSVLATTDWKDETGEGLYLRDDGSIQSRMRYVNNLAEGDATFYNPDGSVERVVRYAAGRPVATQPATVPATQPAGPSGPG